jgi:mannosyl-oligosaccharide alpha-1,2-mannosidase
MFKAIDAATKMEFGNAALSNMMKTPPDKYDGIKSFWLAETLKYFYLIFSDPGLVSPDEFVLNTEADAFRIPHR